jgi:hypothetical protein
LKKWGKEEIRKGRALKAWRKFIFSKGKIKQRKLTKNSKSENRWPDGQHAAGRAAKKNKKK